MTNDVDYRGDVIGPAGAVDIEMFKVQGTLPNPHVGAEKRNIDMRRGNTSHTVKVGGSLDAFVSASIQCGSFGGGMWFLTRWEDSDVDVKLECDVSSDPNLYIKHYP